MRGFIKYLFALLLLISFQQVHAQFRLIMEIAVTDEGKRLSGAEIKVYKNGSLVETVSTDSKGLADIACDPNSIYSIEIGGNRGMVKKKIEVNTKDVTLESAKGDIFFPATVELFEKIEGMDVSILDEPIGKIKFDDKYGDFDSDAAYTKSVQKRLTDLEADFLAKRADDQANKADAMKAYDAAIKIADKAFSSEEWEQAAEQYRIAEKVNPDPLETYPSFQLAELKTKLIKIEADNKRYNEAVVKADAAVASKNYEIAIAEFKRASGYKPNEDYPQNKIKEVQGILANSMKVEQSYLAAIEQGDNALKINDIKSAKLAFEEAAGLKPEESYPKNKIAEIDDILAKQEAKKAEYENAIEEADAALAAKDYETAKTSYKKASTVRPTEQYPKDQMTRVDGLIAGAVKLEQDYLAAVEKGDNALKTTSYQDAKAAYETAGKLKPEETYPKDKIKEINDFITKDLALEETYQAKITAGDKAFSDKDYKGAKLAFTEAKSLKPSETYPQEKITQIVGLLANLAKVEENYKAAIAKGDAAIRSEDFEAAKTAFTEALTLKAEEQYPKDKLDEIGKIVLSNQKSEEEYKKSIQDGDDALADKNYDKAKEFYGTAAGVKPEEAYPKDKLAEIEKTLATEAAAEKAYKDAIAAADGAMNAKELEKAKVSYEKASGLRPEESYPKDQLAKIKTQLSANQELEANYATAIKQGDAALSGKDYEKATAAFTSALDVKPDEEYPKAKLTEIEGIVAALKGKEEKYTAAISKGDAALGNDDFEGAKTAFEEALAIKDENYPKEKIAEIIAKLKSIAEEQAANEKLETAYQAAVVEGDQFGGENKYDEAIAAYTKASELKPEEKYPKEKISDLKSAKDAATKEAELAEIQKQYDDKIALADKAFEAGDLEIARTEYAAAASFKSEESYPKEKIKSITATLANAAEEDQKYKDAISAADKFIVEEKWEEAKGKYSESLTYKPDQEFPKEKITEIDERLAELAAEQEEIRLKNEKSEAIEANYAAVISAADDLFKGGKYEEAKSKYEAAIAVKDEQYPKDKLADIATKIAAALGEKAAAAAQAKIDAEYKALLAEADVLLDAGEFEKSKSKYQSAIGIKEEQYPKDKLAEIETKIAAALGEEAAAASAAAQAKINSEYQGLLAEADGLLEAGEFEKSKSKYQAAIAVKDEQYPKDKLAEIETKIAAALGEEAAAASAAAQAKINSEYQGLLAEADASFVSKEFKKAKASYQAALAVKDEAYPKEQISKIDEATKAAANAKVAAVQAAKLNQDYLAALEKGDQAILSNDLENALKAFQNAQELKPKESYPPQKIAEIDGLIANRSAVDEAKQVELNKNYNNFMQEGKMAKEAKDWEKAITQYQQAQNTLPREELPSLKIKEIMDLKKQFAAQEDEIRLRQEQAASNENSYQTAIANGDKYFRAKNYNDAENEYRLALGLKVNAAYPQEQLDLINSILDEQKAAKLAASTATKAAGQKEQRYKELIAQGDDNFQAKAYQNAKSNFQKALKIKPIEEYPTAQITLIDELLKKEQLAEEKRKKELDQPIQIQKGAKSTINGDAEAEIELIYKELWAKQNSDKNIKLQEQEALLAKVRVENLAREESQRKNAMEQLEEISISMKDQLEMSSELNLQHYETVKEQESDLKNSSEELGKASERRREEQILDKELLAENISLYHQKRTEELVEGKKEMVENEYEEVNVSEQNKTKRQQEYILDNSQKFEEIRTGIKDQYATNSERNLQHYETVKEQEGELKNAREELGKDSERKREEQMLDKEALAKNISLYHQKRTEELVEGKKEMVENEYKEVNVSVQNKTKRQQEYILDNSRKLEEVRTGIKDQYATNAERNIQHYETVKEQESELRNAREDLAKDSERKREERALDRDLLAKSIALYNQKRTEELVEGKKEMVENEYEEVNVSIQNRTDRQQAYILDKDKKFGDLESRLMEFHQGRSTEFYPENYQQILEEKERYVVKQMRDTENSEVKRLLNQEEANKMSTSIRQFSEKNESGFKNNQLEIEALKEDLRTQTVELESESEKRRKNNKEQEFYTGEKQKRQDQSAADYPQGISEEVVENQNNSTTIKRVVVEGTQADFYEKTLYQWGGIFYTKNGTNITKDIWDKESR